MRSADSQKKDSSNISENAANLQRENLQRLPWSSPQPLDCEEHDNRNLAGH